MDPKFHYRIHNSQPLVPTLSQMYPINTFPLYIPKTITILFSHLRLDLPNSLFPSGFPTKILWEFLISPMHASCPAHLTHFDLIQRG
jgi:hypothetical protein